MNSGDQISYLKLEKRIIKNDRPHWQCKCICGKIVIRREDYIKNTKEQIRSCGCKHPSKETAEKNHNWKGFGKIGANFFSHASRKHGKYTEECTITIEYIWNLFQKQNAQCALTGQILKFRKSRKHTNEQTASLDRIDSKKGYTLDNVQWVHKDVQMMKNHFDQSYYINTCKLIYENSINPPIITPLAEPAIIYSHLSVEDLKKGLKIGPYTLIKKAKYKKNRIRWKCLCECGKHRYIIDKFLPKIKNEVCDCSTKQRLMGKDTLKWQGCGDIRGAYFATTKLSAKNRNIPFNLTIEQMWQQFEKQGGVCALTNIPLTFTMSGKKHLKTNQTASLDRIDSSKGYSAGNIQWIHKNVQRMKNRFAQDYFIHICGLVARRATASEPEVSSELQPEIAEAVE